MALDKSRSEVGPLPWWKVLEEELIVQGFEEEVRLARQSQGLGEPLSVLPEAYEPRLWLETLVQLCHKHPRIALCLSGGGIRSATFGLGVVQALARRKRLSRLHYLSTVSGGGYLGGWLSAWIHRQGLDFVESELAQHQPVWTEGTGRYAHGPEPQPEALPVWRLRAFSNYLSPRMGFFSLDLWTLVATVLRNLLIHASVIVPLLLALLLLPRLVLGYSVQLGPWKGPFAVGFACVTFALALVQRRPSEDGRPRMRIDRLNVPLILWLGVLALSLAWIWIPAHGGLASFLNWNLLALLGLISALGGALISLLDRGRPEGGPESLNWWVLGLDFLIGLVLALGVLFTAQHPTSGTGTSALPLRVTLGPLLVGLLIFILSSLPIAFFSRGRMVGNLDREWYARLGAWSLLLGTGWALLAGLSLYGPWILAKAPEVYAGLTGSSLLLGLWGFLSSSGRGEEKKDGWFKSFLMGQLAPIGGTVAALLIPILLAAGLNAWFSYGASQEVPLPTHVGIVKLQPVEGNPSLKAELHLESGTDRVPWSDHLEFHRRAALERLTSSNLPPFALGSHGMLLLWFLIFAVISLALGLAFPLQEYSLHALYRNRLVRAYLGASVEHRRPDPFTGFFPADDVPLKDLSKQRPLLVVNTALNQTFGEKLAWQERKASSFTLTPLHCGGFFQVGYQPTFGCRRDYAGSLTLGTAIAISGAAANPNMGYHSSPGLAFVMTFLGLRLGRWLPNPGAPGRQNWSLAYPWGEMRYLVEDLFGHADALSRFVCLSDGGHFENLGLYEMVARRCLLILVSDAGADPAFEYEDLGNAIKKIRIDLGIPIRFDRPLPRARKLGRGLSENVELCIGTIDYAAVDGKGVPPGTLIYLKPQLWKNAPADIQTYAAAHSDFPHQFTGNQFYTESQFEAYRALGFEIASAIPNIQFP